MPTAPNLDYIKKLCQNSVFFESDSLDLSKGVRVVYRQGTPKEKVAAAYAEFGAWHALNVRPSITGHFSGYDCIVFNEEVRG